MCFRETCNNLDTCFRYRANKDRHELMKPKKDIRFERKNLHWLQESNNLWKGKNSKIYKKLNLKKCLPIMNFSCNIIAPAYNNKNKHNIID